MYPGAYPGPTEGSTRQRIRAVLELDRDRQASLPAFAQPRRAVAARGPQAAALPSGLRIVDASVQPLRVEAHRIGNTQHDHLPACVGDEAVVEVARRHRNVLAQPERVVLVHPGVIARLRAVVAHAPEARPGILVEGPAFGTVVALCV